MSQWAAAAGPPDAARAGDIDVNEEHFPPSDSGPATIASADGLWNILFRFAFGLVAPWACIGLWGLMVAYIVLTLLRERERFLSHQRAKRANFATYLLYRFGHWYSWTRGASAAVLLSLTGSLLVVGALLHTVAAEQASFSSSLWNSWIWIAAPDGGSSAEPGGETVGMAVSIGGMLVFAMLISLVTAEFESTLWHLRHGSIPVVEGNHTVILGWTVISPHVIRELCMAMESEGGGFIVVLAPFPKPDIEQKLQDAEINFRNSTVVVRSGQAHFKEDLAKVAVGTAKRILVLADTSVSHEAADARTLNVLLTLNRMLADQHVPADVSDHRSSSEGSSGRRSSSERSPGAGKDAESRSSSKRSSGAGRDAEAAYVVAECCLVRNKNLFRSMAYGRMEVLCTQDFVSQLAVVSSRQRGLSLVITEMCGFSGSELYIARVGGLEGKRFSELQRHMPDVVPLGYAEENGQLVLAPELSYVFTGTEQLIMLAEDRSTLPAALLPAPPSTAELGHRKVVASGRRVPAAALQTELVVFIGWSDAVGSMLPELDALLGPESDVIIYSSQSVEEREEFLSNSQKRRQRHYENLRISHVVGPLGARYKLEELPLERASKVFILADSDVCSAEEADAHTVAAILQVRDILLNRSDVRHLSGLVIVPQVLGQIAVDACNFCELTDYIDSPNLSASVLASILEVPDMCQLLEELILSKNGTRLYVRRIRDYMADRPSDQDDPPLGQGEGGVSNEEVALNFWELAELAAKSAEILIGYQDARHNWVLNPEEKGEPLEWDVDDQCLAVVKCSERKKATSRFQNVANMIVAGKRMSLTSLGRQWRSAPGGSDPLVRKSSLPFALPAGSAMAADLEL